MTTTPGTPSILTRTPDPNPSVGLVLPGAGGLMASTETTLGAVWRMTASNRSPSWAGLRAGGGAGRDGWARSGWAELSKNVPAAPPPNAQLPRKRALANRFIGGVTAKVRGRGPS